MTYDIRRQFVSPIQGVLKDDPTGEGSAVPIVFGTQQVKPKLIAFGNGGGGGEIKRMWFSVCHGPVDMFGVSNKMTTFIGNVTQFTDQVHTIYDGDPTTPIDDIDRPTAEWLEANRSVYLHTINFVVPPMLGIAHFSLTYASDFWTDAMIEDKDLNNEAPPDDFNIVVRSNLANVSPFANWKVTQTISLPAPMEVDYGDNPAAVIYALMTSTIYGLAIDPDDIDLVSFQQAADYFSAQYYGVNLQVKKLDAIRKVIDQIQVNYGCQLILDDEGKFQLRPLYSPEGLAVQDTLTKDDFLDFKVTTQSWDETLNRLDAKTTQAYEIEYNPVEEDFGVTGRRDVARDVALSVYNQSNEFLTGTTRKGSIDLTLHREPLMAAKRLYEILREESFPRTTVTGRVGLKYLKHLPGEVIRIVHPEYAIDSPFRIRHRSLEKQDKGSVQLTCDQISDAVYDTFYTGAGYTSEVVLSTALETEILTFPAYSWKSTVSVGLYTNFRLIRVYWGENQLMSGWVLTNEEGGNQFDCQLNDEGGGKISITLLGPGVVQTRYDMTPIVQANSLGEMFVRVFETEA